jgi:DNA-binding response OmpR family regulator
MDEERPANEAAPSVLIVEDERGTAQMYRIILEVEGYQVVVAHTAAAAIAALEEEEPDIMLLDVVLRGTSGLDLCRHIREEMELTDLPIIIVSVRGSPDDVQAGFESGADAYLKKPVSQDELLEAVRRGLEARGSILQA